MAEENIYHLQSIIQNISKIYSRNKLNMIMVKQSKQLPIRFIYVFIQDDTATDYTIIPKMFSPVPKMFIIVSQQY